MLLEEAIKEVVGLRHVSQQCFLQFVIIGEELSEEAMILGRWSVKGRRHMLLWRWLERRRIEMRLWNVNVLERWKYLRS